MMMSKIEGRKKIGEKSGKGKLLNEIEAISKALYADKTRPPRSAISTVSSRSKSVGKTHLLEPPKSKLKDGNGNNNNNKDHPSDKDNNKSIWSWKALKANFTHVRNRRFNCCFTLQVHSIEGLPLNFNDLSLVVHWKRRDGGLMTRPARVFQGIAEFEEKLTHTCLVYGSRNGPHQSAKYEAKHFMLYTSVFGTPEVDLGKHRVDLTRLLPLTLEELEEEKGWGMWTTSFRLSGKAKGANLNVSFQYSVIGNNSMPTTAASRNVPNAWNLRQNSASTVKPMRELNQRDYRSSIPRAESVPGRSSTLQRPPEGIKDLHEVLPISKSDLSESVHILYKKFDEGSFNASVDYKPELDAFSESFEPLKPNSYLSSNDVEENVQKECEVCEFTIVEQGIEFPFEEPVKLEEKVADVSAVESLVDSTVEMALVGETKLRPPVEDIGSHRNEYVVTDFKSEANNICTEESLMEALESTLTSVSNLVKDESDSQEDEGEIKDRKSCLEGKSNFMGLRKGKSLSLDYDTESVASEFLDMLGIVHSPFGVSSESEPDSPRERLLKQFEKDTLASGCSLFDFGIDDQTEYGCEATAGFGWETIYNDFDGPSLVQASEEMPKIANEALRNRTKASMLEDLETEALMREWGLNEKTFHCSSPNTSGGFGSPINLAPEYPPKLPSLGEGLGPFIETKNGGFLRSMNPSFFSNAKNGGSLIMQVSSPVVVPAEMGSGITEILQHLASVGIEKLSMQAKKLMPLEDVTGKTMQQIAWEAAPSLEGAKRQDFWQQKTSVGQKRVEEKSLGPRSSKSESSSIGNETDSEYVSLEDLAPLAIDKIEALSIEGLRIQSGMSDEDASSNISTQSIGEFSAIEGKGINVVGSLGLEGAGGLQLMDIVDNGDDVDGLMGLSLTLDEWMKLDSGEIEDEDEISEKTSKILAAHHATSLDMIRGRSKGEKRRGKGSARKCGLLGNNFTVALMVQLRDPLRNYEPVGTPMLALIQVERVFVPPKPTIYSTVSGMRKKYDEDESEPANEEGIKETAKEDKNIEEEGIPQFKITEVHVAGLKNEPGEKHRWGSSAQQQSGSRWLVANGMGKKNKNPIMKSKALAKSSSPATTTVQSGNTLWGISSRVQVKEQNRWSWFR